MLLKLIVSCGLSPQMALADDCNNYKSNSEQLFHTRGKPFAALHPMGVFANHPEVLQLQDHDVVDVPGFKTKQQFSNKHQLLVYVTLLETNKVILIFSITLSYHFDVHLILVSDIYHFLRRESFFFNVNFKKTDCLFLFDKLYVVNAMRMPAAQTLLLFSPSMDTNSNFSRIVCDSWIELQFPDAAAAQSLLLKACQLRQRHLQSFHLNANSISTIFRVTKNPLQCSRIFKRTFGNTS